MKVFPFSLFLIFSAATFGTDAKPIVIEKNENSIKIGDDNNSGGLRNRKQFEGTPGENAVGHNLVFTLGPGRIIQIFTSPWTDELSIHLRGQQDPLTQEEKEYLKDIDNLLNDDNDIDTETIDSIGCQGRRIAKLLTRWPDTLAIDYELDIAAEMARQDALNKYDEEHPLSDTAPVVPGGDERRELGSDPVKHPNRRLAYTSLCSSLNTYVRVTHDDWWYDNLDDGSTFFAYISSIGDGPCDDGTYFWKNGNWVCYEPDHDSSVEYAYGGCFGRCGGGCGSGNQYTQDCANHDSCVRFGHGLASGWCNDEFSFTVDDAAFAPDCF